jgi:hypothetical protein
MEEVRNEARASGEAFAAFRRCRHWRPRHWFLFSIPLAVSLAIAWLHVTSPPPDLSVEKYKRICEGMTEAEVEEIIGARPVGYGYFVGPGDVLEEDWHSAVRWLRWSDSAGYLSVGLDADGRVSTKSFQYHSGSERSTRQRGSWWAELRRRCVTREPGIIYISF